MLVGRDAERQLLDRLLQRACAAHGGVLVLRGEPGIGKTALLNYATSQAGSMCILRASGFESETGLAFGGLYSLLRPLAGHLDALPEQQRAALRAALGLDSERAYAAPEQLAIAVGTHSLLTTAAEAQPLLLLVDDAHWLDLATTHALAFALRRIAADAIACVLTTQPGAAGLDGLPVHSLAGLDAADSARVIADVAGTTPAAGVAARLFAETGGNPLALTEIAAALTVEQLRRPGAPEMAQLPPDPGAEVRRRYSARLAALDPALGITLVVAAAAGRCEAQAVLAAAARAGGTANLADAEDSRLVRLAEGSVEFLHPLVRSVAYHSASASQRRSAHRALADVLAGVDAERAASHRAEAATGTDEGAAAALDWAATLAEGRGAPLEAVAAWERAARLSEPGDARTRRLLRAAEAALQGGDLDRAERLAAVPATGVAPERQARQLAVRGRVGFLRGHMDAAQRALREAAELVAHQEPRYAAELLLQSFDAAVEAALIDEAGKSAELLGQLAGHLSRFHTELAAGELAWLRGDPSLGMALLKRSTALLENDSMFAAHADEYIAAARAWACVGDPVQGRRYAGRAVEQARSEGALGVLPRALADASWMHSQTGSWAPALAHGCEALDMARASGQRLLACDVLITISFIEAAQGREADCRAHAEEAAGLAVELGLPLYRLVVQRQVALLEFGMGRLEEAIGRLEQARKLAADLDVHHPYYSPLPDLIEAYAQSGKPDRARDLLREFLVLVPGEDNPLPAGRAACCRGIVAEGDFDPHFRHAIELQEHSDAAFQLGRTYLCYGERLRRARRRREARTQLRAAIEIFGRLDARPWADRAWAELRATGETVATGQAPQQLTPQELQIAMLVAEGRTNAEVGRALFLSTRTVEFHLSRAFRKLGVTTRTELTRQLTAAAAQAG